MTIKDLKVERLYVEEKLEIVNEIYLGVTIDRDKKQHVVLASSEGGMDIEEVAARTPEKIIRFYVDPLTGLRDYHANYIASKLGYRGSMMRKFSARTQWPITRQKEISSCLTSV